MDKQEELKKVEGTIDARSVDNMGIMIGRDWFNFDSNASTIDKEDMRGRLGALKKGDKIKMTMSDEKHYKDVEVLERAPEEKSRFGNMTTFKELLERAHKENKFNGLRTEVLAYDVEKRFALVKATVYVKHGDIINQYEAHGDADPSNMTTDKIKPHYIRMAETRAISRALRFALGEADTAIEETSDAEIEDVPKPYHG